MRRIAVGMACMVLGTTAVAAAWLARAEPDPTALHEAWDAQMGRASARVHRFHVDVARARIDLVDLGFTTLLGDALGDADLVINGGYWAWYGRQRRAQGLVAAGAQTLAPLTATFGGGVLVVRGGRASLETPSPAVPSGNPELAVQCFPRLVVKGHAVAGLNDKARAARTVACVRDAGKSLDVYMTDPDAPSPTLKETASWLVAQGCEAALNFDGGPSTAAAWREGDRAVRLGPGRELPYAIRFRLQPR
jgi:hypothetical protein